MWSLPKQPSIEDIGLKNYLDSSSDRHDGHGYDDFVECLQKELSKPAIAKIFNVGDKKTIYNWIRVYDKEQKHAKSI